MLESRSAAIFPGEKNPANVVHMENQFVRILRKKRRIVEEVKRRVDLYDEHLATKCLLEGVWPPSWLRPPFIPSQTSELDREKIISGVLFPQSRPLIQQADSVVSDIVVREDLTSVVNKPSIQQLVSILGDVLVREDLASSVNNPLEEQQHDLLHNTVRSVSNHCQEQVGSVASLGDVHEQEGLPENVSTGCRENQSCPSLEYSENQGVNNTLDATTPGHIQGEMVGKSFSTGYCQDETEPNTYLDSGLSLALLRRSKSRQKDLELRSNAKASKSRSSGNSRSEFKASPRGNIGLEIASLRSDSASEIKLFQHDENDEECREEVENNDFGGKGEDQCIKCSSVKKSFNGHTYASVVPESSLESGHANEMDILQSIETIDEVAGKEAEQVDDPQNKSCSETAYLDGGSNSKSLSQDILQSIKRIDEMSAKVDDPQSRSCNETAYLSEDTSSKSLSQDSSKREHQKSSKSISNDFPSRNSNPEGKLPQGAILDSDPVRETVHHMEEAACHNLDQYDVEFQKMFGSASTDHYDVELQKMIGSASSAELRSEEGFLFKEAGLMSPGLLSFRPEQLSVQRSHIAPDQGSVSENMESLLFSGETSHPLASRVIRDSDCSPFLSPLGLIGSNRGSPPVLEGFIIQTDDENQSDSKSLIKCDSFQRRRTTAESATLIEQICKSVCRTTPSVHLTKSFKFNDEMDLDQSVSTKLLDVMFFSQNLEGSSVIDKTVTKHDYSGRSYIDSLLPFSGAASYADARNPRKSPTEKLWYRSLQRSSSSGKRGSQTPDLPCISEENENVDEEAEHLCAKTPKSMSSEKRGSSVQDLPYIAEENENIDEISVAVNEASDFKRENISVVKKSFGDINENSMKFLPSVSKAKIPVDRQSLDSVSTAFCFSAKCNSSVKSKMRRQKGGSRRFTGKGTENQGGVGAGKNGKPPTSRFSKAKLSCSSSLTTLRPRLPEKGPRHNNVVSNITLFAPVVQQQKPAASLITGKRDVKVKALEAAEASKRNAEQKENDRKMKKEAMKLERARLEQENLRKQEIEKKKKEEDRKKKEAEMALKQEVELKKKEEERKRKELEMADRKRQRDEDKKLKEAKRQRIAEIQRQKREADKKLQAEKELKRQATDARIRAQKELKEEQINASRSSKDDDFKVISNPGNMCEESYDISPYKCSDDEEEEEEDDDRANKKFVPTWASKSNVLLNVIRQQNRDPYFNFPATSFCAIRQFSLLRKLR